MRYERVCMRLRYDIYVEFDSPRKEDEIDVLKNIRGAFSEGVMGVSASSLYEDGYVFTGMFYLDLSYIFDDVGERFPGKLPADSEERLERKLESYSDEFIDVAVQRVPSN